MADIYTNKNADTAVILDTEDTSSAVYVGDYCRGSFATDADLDGTSFTFEVSNDKSQWDDLRAAAGTAVTAVTVAASKNYRLPDGVFSYAWLRIKSGSSQSGADTTIRFFLASGAAS